MTFTTICARLFLVSERNTMRNKMKTIEFLNVTFKIKRNPEFKGNHQLCECAHLGGNTFDLGTTEAEMITEITKAQLLALRLGQLKNEGKATSAQISMAKRNNVDMALKIAREARQMLGGMGITGEYSIMRHSMNLESVITYEGTHDIHLLITGLDITGISAFK